MKPVRFIPEISSVLILPAVTLFIAAQANAGAWVPDKGDGYTKFGYSYYEAEDTFDDDPTFIDFEGVNISFYGEYGLGNNLAVYGTLLYQDVEQTTNPTGLAPVKTSNDGLGDAEIGLKYQWQAEPFVVSTSFLVKLPYFYDDDDALPLGNGQEDYEFKVLVGKSLNEYGYYGIEAGYRFRTDEPSDEYRYLLEYGFSFNDNAYFRTKLDGTHSANNADSATGVTSGNLTLAPEFDLGKLELTLGWNFGQRDSNGQRWGIEVTYTNDLYGDNTLEGDNVQLGLTRVF